MFKCNKNAELSSHNELISSPVPSTSSAREQDVDKRKDKRADNPRVWLNSDSEKRKKSSRRRAEDTGGVEERKYQPQSRERQTPRHDNLDYPRDIKKSVEKWYRKEVEIREANRCSRDSHHYERFHRREDRWQNKFKNTSTQLKDGQGQETTKGYSGIQPG